MLLSTTPSTPVDEGVKNKNLCFELPGSQPLARRRIGAARTRLAADRHRITGSTVRAREIHRPRSGWQEDDFCRSVSVRYEAHFPAQQPQASEEPWFSSPHGYACWPRNPEGTPQARPYPTRSLIGRVRSRSRFEALRRSRLRAGVGPVRIAFANGDSIPTDKPHIAFAIGRRVGGAVIRNRLRRRLRAISGELSDRMLSGDYLIAVSAEATKLSYQELRATVSAALAALFERFERGVK